MSTQQIPIPPFYGTTIITVMPEEIYPYINTNALFCGRWDFRQRNLSKQAYEEIMQKKVCSLFNQMKEEYKSILQPKAVYGFYPCRSKDENIFVYDCNGKQEIECFTFPRQKNGKRLCISDFFSSGQMDVLGVFLATVGSAVNAVMNKLKDNNEYAKYFYLYGLAAESTEALAKYTHEKMRNELGIEQVGCRYSFGYPACPNLEEQAKLFHLLQPERIGVALTEAFQMVPEFSTSAIVAHHKEAKYFNV